MTARPRDLARRLAGLALVAPPVVLFLALRETSDAFRDQGLVVLGQGGRRYADHGAVVAGVGWDLLFVAVFAVCGTAAVLVSRRLLAPFRRSRTHVPPGEDEAADPPGPARRWVDGGMWWRGHWWVVVAAALDGLEDVLLLAAPDRPPAWFAAGLAVLGWVKVLAYAMALVVLVVVPVGTSLGVLGNVMAEGLFGILLQRLSHVGTADEPLSPAPVTVGDEPAPGGPPSGIAICVSGGGIRAASVALGALRRLDRDPAEGPDGRTVFAAADHLCSVSGGGFVAGGWRISRQRADTSTPAAGEARDGLFDRGTPWSRWVAAHHRYLRNRPGGLLGGVAQTVVRIVVVTGSIVGTVAWLGVLIGWFLRSPYGIRRLVPHGVAQIVPVVVPDGIPRLTSTLLGPYLLVRWWGPGAVLVVVGVALWIAGPGRPRRLALVAWRCAAVALTALFVLPLLVGAGPSLFAWAVSLVTPVAADRRHDAGLWGTVVTLGSALGIGSAAIGLLTRRLQRLWLRLGGVLLAVLLSVLLIAVARDVAQAPDRDRFGGWGWWLAVAAVLVVVATVWDAHRLTLAGLYRARLAGTFATSSTPAGPDAVPIGYGDELVWSALAGAAGPRLVVAATVQSSRNTVSGLKGCGLTFRSDRIRMFNGPGGGAVDTTAYPTGSFWRGWPRTWSVSRSMAISGAAVASAMGRANLGTTNAVVAALNLRLGMWLPNPARMDVFLGADGVDLPAWQQPRVGYSYLLKELLGRYDLEHDPFVYVADGGHRENLGLVEALRLRPAEVFSIDVSGDRPGSFTTLREALDLAVLELGVVVDLDWDAIVIAAPAPGAPAPALPAGPVAVGVIDYGDGTTGRLYYGRYQLSRRTPEPIRRFAAVHPGFPYYSTADQLLDDDAQGHLVDLGEHLGDALLAAYVTRPGRTPAGTRPGPAAPDRDRTAGTPAPPRSAPSPAGRT